MEINNKLVERLTEKLAKLESEYETASNDSKFRNICFCSAGNLSRGSSKYRLRHRDKICQLVNELARCRRALKIAKGEPFTLRDADQCRLDIMHYHKEYDTPFFSHSPIKEMAEVIRLSFWNGYRSVLGKLPIIIDPNTINGNIAWCYPDGRIEFKTPKRK